MIELEAEGDRRVVVVAIGAHRDPCAIRHLLDHDDVAQRLLGAILLAIAGAEGSAPSFQQLVGIADGAVRSEEHKSELQSLMRISFAVFCLKQTKKIKPCY